MARGGKRRGSGRKVGTANVKSRAIADRAAAAGLTPLEVMLDNLVFLRDAAVAGIVIDPIILGLRKLAGEEAARAAPYMHPRIQPVEEKTAESEQIVPLAERLRYYAARDAVEASEGKVVPIGPIVPKPSGPSI